MAGVIRRLLDHLFGPRVPEAEQDRRDSERIHKQRVRLAQLDALARARRPPPLAYPTRAPELPPLTRQLQRVKDALNRELFG